MRNALSDKGGALIEFAIVLPILVVLSLGTADYGGAVNLATKLNNAARAGAQYGLAHPADTCGIVAAVTGATNDSTTGMTVNVFQGPTTSSSAAISGCSNATAPVAYYCTCSDSGSTATVQDCTTGTCASPAYKNFYVGVSVTQTYRPTLAVSRLAITGSTGLPASTGISMTGKAVIQFQ